MPDGLLGLLLGWIGWASAHVSWGGPAMHRDSSWNGPGRDFPGGWTNVSPALDWWLPVLVAGVAIRRICPRVGFGLVLIGLAGTRALGAGINPSYLALAFGIFAMASAMAVSRWLPLTAGLLILVGAGHWREAAFGLLEPSFYAELLGAASIAILPTTFALLRRTRRENEAREREQLRQRSAEQERLRIAREVHDGLGHSLSVITMQAGVALHVLAKRAAEDPQLAESLTAIRQTSKDALVELRTTIGVFRDPDGNAPRSLRPGLARLEELVGALVAAGRDVRVVGDPDTLEPLPAAVDQAGFRIVQEALTNTVRHSDVAAATVELRQSPGVVIIEVTDDGPAVELPVMGNGMAGMAERAHGVGGTVEFSIMKPHGLSVRATLPSGAA